MATGVANFERGLTPMHEKFVEEYLLDPTSAKRAAIRAGYSINTASESAPRLMADPRIKKRIQEAQKEAAQALGISVARVVQELWKVASANPGDVVEIGPDGEALINPKKASEIAVTTTTDGKDKKIKSVTAKTVKPADKVAALTLASKLLGLFPKEEIEVTGKLTLAELITKSYEGDDVIDTTASEVEDDQVITEIPELSGPKAEI